MLCAGSCFQLLAKRFKILPFKMCYINRNAAVQYYHYYNILTYVARTAQWVEPQPLNNKVPAGVLVCGVYPGSLQPPHEAQKNRFGESE